MQKNSKITTIKTYKSLKKNPQFFKNSRKKKIITKMTIQIKKKKKNYYPKSIHH